MDFTYSYLSYTDSVDTCGVVKVIGLLVVLRTKLNSRKCVPYVADSLWVLNK